jgi:FkbM family methyltransferase
VTTVVDVGAARYGGDRSIEHLIEAFKPDVIWAFDPNPALPDAFDGEAEDGTTVHLRGEAAWTYDGEIGFFSDGLNSKIDLEGQYDWPTVPCFDLANFIRGLTDKQIILKLDAEGSEYALLDHLIETGTDQLLKLAWVEWHCLRCGRGGGGHLGNCGESGDDPRRKELEGRLACELREWRW